MKPTNFIHILLLAALSFLSCKNNNKNQYAIRDFRASLQPGLTKIVTNGVVFYFDSMMRYDVTDIELYKLSRSEHPVLRAAALKEMLRRPSIDHFNVIMNHLDDTAFISADEGEWGYMYTTVSDNMIRNGKWKTEEDKLKTIDALITKHSYLRSAYFGLLKIEPQEKYYTYIREMAQQQRPYEAIECALYALAKYKKPEDITLIREILLGNYWRMGYQSLRLIKQFPNDVYMDVFEKYYPQPFYRNICMKGWENTFDIPDFFKTIAVFKNERSATMLSAILNRKPFMLCSTDSDYLRQELIYAICANDCKAYSAIRKQVLPAYNNYEKRKGTGIYVEPVDMPADTTAEPIRWR